MSLEFGFKAKDLVEEGRITFEEIEEIKAWTKSQKSIPEFSDELLACLLLSCDRDQKFTQKTIVEYLKAKNAAPGIFTKRSVDREEVQNQLNVLHYCPFPVRSEDGCAIIFHGLKDFTYYHYNMEPAMKTLFMTLDAAVYDSPPTGLIILFDMKGVGLMHLTRVKINLLRSFFHYTQEGLPVKLKMIHVFNSVYFIDKVMSIVKPFMKKELMEMLHFHKSDLDMEWFYQNHLPKKCLPADFGGDLPDLATIHEDNKKKLRELDGFFEAEENMRINGNS